MDLLRIVNVILYCGFLRNFFSRQSVNNFYFLAILRKILILFQVFFYLYDGMMSDSFISNNSVFLSGNLIHPCSGKDSKGIVVN